MRFKALFMVRGRFPFFSLLMSFWGHFNWASVDSKFVGGLSLPKQGQKTV